MMRPEQVSRTGSIDGLWAFKSRVKARTQVGVKVIVQECQGHIRLLRALCECCWILDSSDVGMRVLGWLLPAAWDEM